MKVNHRGSGSHQYPPRMMLALLIYCYANGIFGSRRIESATYRDIAVRYITAEELIEQLKMEVDELMKKAEQTDKEGASGQQLPEEIARTKALKEKIQKARKRLEERARRRAEAEKDQYEAKVKERNKRKGSSKGKKIQPPSDKPRPEEQENLTDTDSRIMRKNKRSGYDQKYNAQAVVDADGSQLILGARVSQCASDRNEQAEKTDR